LKFLNRRLIPTSGRSPNRRGTFAHYVNCVIETDVVHTVKKLGKFTEIRAPSTSVSRLLTDVASASDFLFTFSACTTSVRSPEPTWCVYFISNAPFFFTFLLLRCAHSSWHCSGVFSFTFRPLFAPHSTPFYFNSRRRELRFERFYFAFTDIVIVLSICLCFVVLVGFIWPIWVRLCCWFWRHHFGFGFGVTTSVSVLFEIE